MVTADEVDAALILVGVALVLSGFFVWSLIDSGVRAWRLLRITLAFRFDRGLGYDWSRAWRAARRHA